MNMSLIVQNVESLREKHPEISKLFLYLCIGVSALMVDLSVYFLIRYLWETPGWIVTAISTTVAVGYAFALNAHYNFKIKTHLFKRFLSYFSVNLVGLTISIVLIYTLGTHGRFNEDAVKVLSLPLIFVVQFTLNRLITFRTNPSSS